MKKTISIALLISFSVFSVWAETSKEESETIRQQRTFKSKNNIYRILSAPKALIDLPWVPVRGFLNFAERTDLFTRLQDLFYFNEERTFGWFPSFSSGQSGEGIGASIFHRNLFSKRHMANFSATYADDEEFFFRTAYEIPSTPVRANHFKLKLEMIRDSEVEIYTRADSAGNALLGLSPNEEDRKEFSEKRFEGILSLGRKFNPHIDLTVHVRGERNETADAEPLSAPRPLTLKGLNDTVSLIGGGANLALDFRDDPVRPFYGFFAGLGGTAFTSPERTTQGNRYGYSGYTLDLQQFLPIYEPHRVIMLRSTIRHVDPLGDRQIPFFRLPILDLNQSLRSFKRNRFREAGAFTFNVEYRYPIWILWDAYIFLDGGQPFNNYSDLQTRELRFSQGLGIRFISEQKLSVLFQFATGREGQVLTFSIGQIF